MAKLTVSGREYDIAPFKLGAMKAAAPIIERINATIAAKGDGGGTTLVDLTEMLGDFCAVLSIGLMKIDATLTPDHLEDELGFGDMPAIQAAFTAIMRESGLKSAGEVPAPAAGEAAGA
ncbi:hypothetical protein GCM10008023_05970 [Sphingomonas glacialis]|uniref:Phage tail assembly protein n=1 Tax=Sphingomonas glacialis TaxID=658225 RepID=A0ABQ3LAF7_9SPHN|nr:hypothetical protein [Sphingomonas glacialis]GHH09370.1 hypothetical protein GCM10008023_05970 [Sphingomonas glacialis]